MGCCTSFYYNNKSCGLEDTIKNMKQSEVILEKKQEDLEIKIEETKVSALMSAQTDRIAARKSLRKHKRFVKQLQLIDGQLSTLKMERELLEKTFTKDFAKKPRLEYFAMKSMANSDKLETEAEQDLDAIVNETNI